MNTASDTSNSTKEGDTTEISDPLEEAYLKEMEEQEELEELEAKIKQFIEIDIKEETATVAEVDDTVDLEDAAKFDFT